MTNTCKKWLWRGLLILLIIMTFVSQDPIQTLAWGAIGYFGRMMWDLINEKYELSE